MINLGFLLGLCIAFFVVSLIGVFVSFFCYAKIVGMENSTHRIEYRDPLADMGEEDVDEDFNPFASASDDEDSLSDLSAKRREEKLKAKYEREAGLALAGMPDTEY